MMVSFPVLIKAPSAPGPLPLMARCDLELVVLTSLPQASADFGKLRNLLGWKELRKRMMTKRITPSNPWL